MIIFYNNKTGKIVSTVHGRVHQNGTQHLMLMGNNKEYSRLIVEWKEVPIENEEDSVGASHFVPDHHQKDLFEALDKKPTRILDYRVDVKTRELVRNE